MSGVGRLILIRHATTEMAGKLCGQLDPPLNEAGLLQARTLAQHFAREQTARVYASNLRRAVQTAEAIASPLGLQVYKDEDLQEISFGDWEGCRWAELQSRFPEETRQWLDPSLDLRPPNGESMKDFRKRVTRSLVGISSEACGETTAVIAHLGAIRVALVDLASLDPTSDVLRRIEYCSCFEFGTNGNGWTFRRRYRPTEGEV